MKRLTVGQSAENKELCSRQPRWVFKPIIILTRGRHFVEARGKEDICEAMSSEYDRDIALTTTVVLVTYPQPIQSPFS